MPPTDDQPRITLDHVAAACGVHPSTVCRVLHDPRGSLALRPETRQRILDVARDLGYRSRRRSAYRRLIGITATTGIDWCSGPFTGLPALLSAALVAEAMDVVLVSIDGDPEDWELHRRDEQLAGLLCTVGSSHWCETIRRKARMPIVLFNWDVVDQQDQVQPDDRQGMAAAVQHLFELGHHRIAYVQQESHEHRWSMEERAAGARQALARSAASSDHPWSVVHMGIDARAVSETLERLLADGVTAIATYSATEAMALVEVARRRGLCIPGDLSIIAGHDEPATDPLGLSAVVLPVRDMLHAALELMALRRRDPHRPAELRALPERLILRGSTGPVEPARRSAR